MSGHDKKERLIAGGTAEAQDQVAYAAAKSELLRRVRTRKGLPADPIQLDIQAVSQLSDAPRIDDVEKKGIPSRIIDISSLTPNHSAVALTIWQKRLEDKEGKAA